MRVLYTADWHIKLGQNKVPIPWQTSRFHSLVDELNGAFLKHNCDLHVIGGDIFDVAAPNPEEYELYYDLVAKLEHKTIIYTGNHEMKTKKDSMLYKLASETKRCNPLVSVITEPYRSEDFDIVDYVELKKDKWLPAKSKLCFTHVRGEIKPHVKPEIDLSRFKDYPLVISGDLHSHSNTQVHPNGDLVYPGSPMTTSFHRNEVGSYTNGYIVVDTNNLAWQWYELTLPQLLRKTVSTTDEMVDDGYNWTIYELTGDVVELGKLEANSELLDKKINTNITKDAKLQGLDGDINSEVSIYLKEVMGLQDDSIKELVSTLHSEVKNLEI